MKRPRFYYGWVIVLVVALMGFTHSAETFPVLGVFLKPITEEFGWSRSVFTGSMTIGTLLGAVVAIGVGPYLDRFGPRWLMTGTLFLLGVALLLMGRITSLWQFYILQILGRVLAMGVLSIATAVVVPKWFVRKRGRAVALSTMGLRAGNAVTPLYVQFFVSTGSWRVAAGVAGLVVWVVSLVPAALFLRRRPEDMGLLPDGAPPEEQGDNIGHAPDPRGSAEQLLEVSFSLRQVLREPSFYLLVVALSLAFVVSPAISLHMIPYLTDQGISAGIAVAVVAIWSASSALGALISGFLAERFSIRVIMAVAFVLGAVGYALLLLVQTATAALLWGFYFGAVQGGAFTLQHVIFADYYGRESLGAVRSAVWPVQSAANATGPLVAALAYDATGGYRLVFSLFVLANVLSALCIFLAKPPAGAKQRELGVSSEGQAHGPTR